MNSKCTNPSGNPVRCTNDQQEAGEVTESSSTSSEGERHLLAPWTIWPLWPNEEYVESPACSLLTNPNTSVENNRPGLTSEVTCLSVKKKLPIHKYTWCVEDGSNKTTGVSDRRFILEEAAISHQEDETINLLCWHDFFLKILITCQMMGCAEF